MNKFGNDKLNIVDLDIDTLREFIDVDVDEIVISGNVGDPIYHHDFIELVKMCKTKAKKIHIYTNGSYKKREWWKSLNSILDGNDTVIFSIDGTLENFTEYRVNADKDSILIGIEETVTGPAKAVWKYIPFSFNETDIDHADTQSVELGMNEFMVSISDRWDEDDYLKPRNSVHSHENFVRHAATEGLTDIDIKPKCQDDRMHYVSADGYYSPCCHMRHYEFYYSSAWWKNREKHKISDTTLSEQQQHLREFLSTVHDEKPNYCVSFCGRCE